MKILLITFLLTIWTENGVPKNQHMNTSTYSYAVDELNRYMLALFSNEERGDRFTLDYHWMSGDSGDGGISIEGTFTVKGRRLRLTPEKVSHWWWDFPEHGGEGEEQITFTKAIFLEKIEAGVVLKPFGDKSDPVLRCFSEEMTLVEDIGR